jgi:Aspartyl/Asparaginyl beta-hydroxylase
VYSVCGLFGSLDTCEWMRQTALALNLQPGPGGSAMTEIEPTRRAFEERLRQHVILNRHWLSCRLVGIWPSQQIPLHRDAPIQGTRLHIPVQTNQNCWCFSGNDWQQLTHGVIYQMDPTQPHGAVNWGDTIRLHLMIDVEA